MIGRCCAGATVALLLAAAPQAFRGAAPQAETGVHPISGRRFAAVMSFEGADWLDRAERESEEDPDTAVSALRLKKGDSAADIGAGSGYMTVRLAKRVGPSGRVYAVDIQPEMLALLGPRMAREKLANVVPVLSAADDAKLPEQSVDVELLVDVYHEFSQPQAMLRSLRRALKPGGRMVLLEYRKEDRSIPILPEHKMSVAEAKLEVEAEGFKLTHVDEALPRQHILVFTAR